VEQKVQDVKKRVILTLHYGKVLLVFLWCYCLQFIIDCLNHLAHKQLEWRTPMEVPYGHTPGDISMFWFTFWEPIWYYEPTAKYPKPNFLPGRFVGIAWDHGNVFMYRVWMTPKNNWEDGPELACNVVWARHYADGGEPKVSYGDLDLGFERRKVTWKKHGKCKGEAIAESDERGVATELPARETTVSFSVKVAPPISVSERAEEQGGTEEMDIVNNITNNQNSNGLFSSDMAADPTSNPEKRAQEESNDDDGIDYDPLDKDPIQMMDEVNNNLSGNSINSEVGGAQVVAILNHDWYLGQLKVKWNME
jgi:hypothetical protein